MKKSNARPSPSSAKGTRLSADWRDFADRLAQHIPVLSPDQHLILSVPRAHRFVQLTPQGTWGLLLEAVSNGYLELDERLSDREQTALKHIGWQEPTLRPFDDMGDDDVDEGSPNWTLPIQSPVNPVDAALLAVRTLATVYKVRHPSMLQYYAYSVDGPTILLPGLGIPAEPPPLPLEGASSSRSLDGIVADACLAAADSDVRKDGDVHLLEVDSVPFRVTTEIEAGVVRVLSRVMPVDEIGGNLFELMNRLNGTYLSFGYCFVRDGDIRWATELVDEPFNGQSLVTALQRGAETVKGILAMRHKD